MSDTIKSLLNHENVETFSIIIKVLKQTDENSYLVKDKSMLALLYMENNEVHLESLKSGHWYKLIECQKNKSTMIKIDQMFMPVKLVRTENKKRRMRMNKLSAMNVQQYHDFHESVQYCNDYCSK